jgi:uncharacterized protein YjbJ (UPF0337 family)
MRSPVVISIAIVRHAGRFPASVLLESMMSTNKDQVKGRIEEAKGKVKEVAGKLVGNKSLEAKGKVQKTLGKARAKFGDVKQQVKVAQKQAAKKKVAKKKAA